MNKFFLLIPAVFLLLPSGALAQQRLNITPPPSLDNADSTRANTSAAAQRQIDLAAMQKEADDLARTAQSIPLDMESVRKGTLPKDFVLKLKQIEKLSKHLRSQIAP